MIAFLIFHAMIVAFFVYLCETMLGKGGWLAYFVVSHVWGFWGIYSQNPKLWAQAYKAWYNIVKIRESRPRWDN